MRTSLILALCLLAFSAHAVSKNGPKVGEQPPLLQTTTLLQAPPSTKFDAESLRGKVVVLEFWATWCGPCIMAIPHLNELAERFKDQPVQFIAITAEDEATVKPFLNKRPIKAWVALDADKAMNKAYGITGIPHTVVLGKDGTVAAIAYPTSLTDQHINDLLAGKRISLAEPASDQGVTAGEDSDDKSQAKPLFQVLIRPSANTNNSQAVWGGGRLTASSQTVWGILPLAFHQSPVRILTNAPLPEGKYDFVVAQPNSEGEEMGALLQQAIKSAFRLTARKESKQVDVLLLRVKDPQAQGLVISATPGGSSRSGPGIIEGINLSIASLASNLEGKLETVVIDETGLTNRYDISLKLEEASGTKPNREGLVKALREQLGLELLPERRPVEMLVVEKVKSGVKRDEN